MKDVYQKLFDTALHGLRLQDGPSTEWNGEESVNVCSYRGTNGRKCAVGHLIKDEYYGRELEGHSPKVGTVMESVIRSMKIDPHICDVEKLKIFLREMQLTMHDNINEQHMKVNPKNPVKFWHDRLENRAEMFAAKYGLEYSG